MPAMIKSATPGRRTFAKKTHIAASGASATGKTSASGVATKLVKGNPLKSPAAGKRPQPLK